MWIKPKVILIFQSPAIFFVLFNILYTVTYITDQEKEVSKMFFITLGNSIELESPWSQMVCTLEYGQLNQPSTAHLVPEI